MLLSVRLTCKPFFFYDLLLLLKVDYETIFDFFGVLNSHSLVFRYVRLARQLAVGFLAKVLRTSSS